MVTSPICLLPPNCPHLPSPPHPPSHPLLVTLIGSEGTTMQTYLALSLLGSGKINCLEQQSNTCCPFCQIHIKTDPVCRWGCWEFWLCFSFHSSFCCFFSIASSFLTVPFEAVWMWVDWSLVWRWWRLILITSLPVQPMRKLSWCDENDAVLTQSWEHGVGAFSNKPCNM